MALALILQKDTIVTMDSIHYPSIGVGKQISGTMNLRRFFLPVWTSR
ncbi:hypothetical protein GGR92_004674 [Spirosoma lacussanchae]